MEPLLSTAVEVLRIGTVRGVDESETLDLRTTEVTAVLEGEPSVGSRMRRNREGIELLHRRAHFVTLLRTAQIWPRVGDIEFE
jgi:hypothetical protein